MKFVAMIASLLLLGKSLAALDLRVRSVIEIAEFEQHQHSVFRDNCLTNDSTDDASTNPYRVRFATAWRFVGDNKVAVWDLRTGTEVWSRFLDGPILQVKQRQSRVVALTLRTLTGFEEEDGRIVWQYDLRERHFNDTAQIGTRFVVFHRSGDLEGAEPSRFASFALFPDGETIHLVLDDGTFLLLVPRAHRAERVSVPNPLPAVGAGYLPSIVGTGVYSVSSASRQREVCAVSRAGSIAWTFVLPSDDWFSTAKELDGRFYVYGGKHIYLLDDHGKYIAQSPVVKFRDSVAPVTGVWNDIILAAEEDRGLLAYTPGLLGPMWVFRAPHRVEARIGLVSLGSMGAWQGAAIRLEATGERPLIVQQHDSLFGLDPRSGRVLSQVRLLELQEPTGFFSFGSGMLTPTAPPYVDYAARTMKVVVGSVTGPVERSFDKQTERDFLVEVTW